MNPQAGAIASGAKPGDVGRPVKPPGHRGPGEAAQIKRPQWRA